VPYGNFTNSRRVIPADQAPVTKADPNAPDPGASGLYASVTPGYFDAIGVHILRGRDFTTAEAENKVRRLLTLRLHPMDWEKDFVTLEDDAGHILVTWLHGILHA